MKASLVLCTACAAIFSSSALATPRIESLSVKPAAKTPGEMDFTVTIERPTPLDIVKCEVAVDVGDGSKPLHLTFDIGERRTKTANHTYKKAGTYKVKATGTGSRHCEGSREATITVAISGAKPALAGPSCPAGWSLVADTVKGDRYTCRATVPDKPLACAAGTKYFVAKGEIGCR
jgi:hypothetical protein